ncbi:allantoinase [Sistotremastrum suecicum HHB10207 ss-3]|uniref:allantoinase n=1 Tax=Sistotremastrum suecicum HHB10207 ss-3 TaxID=1314776 RepID=A0A166CJJ1_9AGAM|nr:allantoinase [Sistotremastrum suecicum HHB10207 ss-3]
MELIVFTSENVVLPDHEGPVAATIEVNRETGKIVRILLGRSTRYDYRSLSDDQWVDAGSLYLLPGLVDAHVHLNEPGRTEWEGFWTGTRAAASGGVTTVVDMPLNSIPPTTTVENLELKRQAAEGQCWVDVAFWGGIIPGNQEHLIPLLDNGVKGFKCFMIESGVEEFPCVTDEDIALAFETLKDRSTVVLFHAELESPTTPIPAPHDPSPTTFHFQDPTHYTTFLSSRPPHLETNAITLLTSLQEPFPNIRTHIVHLSAADAIPIVVTAKSPVPPSKPLNMSVETCFHYLCLEADSIPDGKPIFKCCPPIRHKENRDRLWDALLDGTISCVVSDHSPCVASLKHLDDGNIMDAWGGISSLGLGLSLLWTEGRRRKIKNLIRNIIRWSAENTAKHAGLDHTKGKLAPGMDADIVIWDPHMRHTITKEKLGFKNKLSPYEGHTLHGQVRRTYLRGQLVWEYGDGPEVSSMSGSQGFGERKPIGQLL